MIERTGAARCEPDTAELSEEQFYAFYRWCLNPVLSLRELLQHLREELDRYPTLQADWQRQESEVNQHLFACAIACTIDDYLAWRPWDVALAAIRFPRWRWAVTSAQWLLNLPHALLRLASDGRIARWRRDWEPCVERLCRALVDQDLAPGGTPAEVGTGEDWGRMLRALAEAQLPEPLLARRMRLPEAYRCQDLTHRDVLAMAQRFAAAHRDAGKGTVVVGVRTAGAYFAPLVQAYLTRLGWRRVSWFTIRPKERISRWERRKLRRLPGESGRVLVVDDHPNTGLTLHLAVRLLKRFGVRPERITLLVPRHWAREDWSLPDPEGGGEGITLVTLEPGESHKTGLLEPRSIEPLLRDYYRDFQQVCLQESREVDEINARFRRHQGDGFQVRQKRVFEVRLGREHEKPIAQRILAKSVGWGWLGYHAYLIGNSLAGSVPRIIGLRHGMLMTEWRSASGRDRRGAAPLRAPLIAAYVGQRVRRLPLTEDPCFDSPGYRWTGWDEIVGILRGVYGPYLGRLKARVIRRRLRRCLSPRPTVVDGRMGPEEWVEDESGIAKVDFEQHNFGGAELDVVDPAYDLAAATFEFSLSDEEERELLRAYGSEAGDRTVADRILLYELLYGVLTMKRAIRAIGRCTSRERQELWHRRYLSARNFLIFRMNRFSAGLLNRPAPPQWSGRLFFLDLDGVFDRQLLGFPHTTASGLEALELLRSQDFSVVLNTGRSVEHVLNYCRTYGLPGGLAEYGSVFVDAVRGSQVRLGDVEAEEQLVRCRAALERKPDLFLDPGYRYSVRAYRFLDERTVGLPATEVQATLERCRCDRLAVIAAPEDTYVVRQGVGKGAGLEAVRRYLGSMDEPVAAMGDSGQDLAALEAAEITYAPANASIRVRHQIRKKLNGRVTRAAFQRGFLEAARHLLHQSSASDASEFHAPCRGGAARDLLEALWKVADRPRYRQILSCLDWRGL